MLSAHQHFVGLAAYLQEVEVGGQGEGVAACSTGSLLDELALEGVEGYGCGLGARE